MKTLSSKSKRSVRDLNVLPPAERRRILEEWNATAVDYPYAGSMVEIFEDQAQRKPDSIAVAAEGQYCSYGSLNRRANQLARHLQSLGVGPEVRVALFGERSLEMLTALWGVLKAGGAYVPLDVQAPAGRLRAMLDDAQIAVVLTVESRRSDLPSHWAQVVTLDGDWEQISEYDAEDLAQKPEPATLAYAIFTSGSTGKPKAVGIEHRQIVHYVQSVGSRLEMDECVTYALVSTLAADLGHTVTYVAFAQGGTLHVAPEWETGEVGKFLERERVDCVKITPSYCKTLVERGEQMPVRRLVLGGEASDSGWVQSLYQLSSSCRIWNHYGPTECTVGSTVYAIPAEGEKGAVPIGAPLPNAQVYVLDGAMRPVPIGAPGELYIGGKGVARGYVNRPELSAERFVPNPYCWTPGERLYRTGDRVRWRQDGNVEFLGRFDEQVKLRGYRIELGEIEAVLAEHAAVSQAVVTARGEGDSKKIVAYLVYRTGTAPDTRELRAHVQGKLPEYMTPSAFVTLDRLPLTPNGKLDRKALPEPEEKTEGREQYDGPRTPVEEILAGIWQQVLHRKQIGREENFFELGGHSLLATQMVSRVRSAIQVELPLRALFESPTIAGLAAEVEKARRRGEALQKPAIAAAGRDRALPLSYAQQRLWFIDQLEPGSTAYNMPMGVRLEGPLDREALDRTLTEMVRRHEVLRTTFPSQAGEAVQRISEPIPVSAPLVDLRSFPTREAVAERLAREEANRPFNLANGPMFRIQLLQLADNDHVLLATMHHIASDGWSGAVMVRELRALYEAFHEGKPSPFPDLTVQYADYAVWQRDWLQGEVLEQQLAYWKQQLEGLEPIELPADRPRPAVPTRRGGLVPFRVSAENTRRLEELSREQGGTLFMTLLAAFQLVLGKWSGKQDIALGTPIANRNHLETEGLIGFFVNQLVLRTQWSDDASFVELLQGVKKTVLEAYEHQDVPFDKLVEKFEPQRAANRSPLIQAILVWQNAPREQLRLPGIGLKGIRRGDEGADIDMGQFDLRIALSQNPQGVGGFIKYASDLFDHGTIERLAQHLETLLNRVIEDPRAPVSGIELLSAPERRQIVETWNATDIEFPLEQSVHELFREQAERTPDAVALAFEDQHLTYRELERRSNQLAQYLRASGVGPEAPVAIYLERSLEMIVAPLAVLKAGGAYIPLDTGAPHSRLASMLEDAGPIAIVTHSSIEGGLPSSWVQTIAIDRVWDSLATLSDSPPAPCVSGDNAAYIIYTSGSTGLPKGVAVTHRGVRNLTAANTAAMESVSGRRVLQFASPSFDAAVWEWTGALLRGSVLVVAPKDSLTPGSPLQELLRRQAVEVVTIPPSCLAAMEQENLPGLRTVVVAGEACSADLAARWSRGRRMLNAYGPTEVTVCATISSEIEGRGIPPIGKPIWNTQVYVLDAHMRPLPVGAPGELYVGGAGLARGYVNRPDLTAGRFVPNPFSAQPGGRLYRTGDRVKWHSDGNLEFLGRNDEQVKLRGYRIELGEIEAVLREHEAVAQAAAIVLGEGSDKRLVAYVVPSTAAAPGALELRAHLQKKLPDYMVPAAFVALERLPLTISGKLDRRALPEPEEPSGAREQYEGPRTPLEEILAGIWEQVLTRKWIGRTENLFELGGHSLLATQLISRVRSALDVELPLRVLFESPTIASLAVAIERARRRGEASRKPPLSAAGRNRELPLSFAQQRLWFIDQLEPGQPAYNIPMGLRLEGVLNRAAVERSVSEIVRRHEVLRTSFPSRNGEAVQRIAEVDDVAVPLVDLRSFPNPEKLARILAQNEAERPFDLGRGPVLRVTLLQLAAEDHVLLITIHHIASDGWSGGVMVREFGKLYEAYRAGNSSPLPELPVQYADYALWQREWLQGETLEQELGYWKQQLAGLEPLELPTDHPRPAVPSRRGGHLPLHIPAETTRKLEDLSREHGATLFMTVLAAFQVVLGSCSGQRDVAIGTDIANRNHLDTEGLIGFFVNQLVLRSQWTSDMSFADLLLRVKKTVLEAYEHQDVPFEKLVEVLEPARSLNRSPLFQVKLVLRNDPREALQMSGLQLSNAGSGSDSVKTDLHLMLRDSGDGLRGVLSYSIDIFERMTAGRLLQQWVGVLEQVAADATRPIGELSVLEPAERQQMVEDWNATEFPFAQQLTAAELFRQQVERSPNAIALEFQQQCLTYGELEQRANRLAHRLQSYGVGPEVRVGICLERSIDMVVAVLAVLKAGGSYLPLDPDFPSARLALVLEDALPAVILVHSATAEVLPSTWAYVLRLDELIEDGFTCDAPESGVTVANEAYVIYTSGSTGRPKGVSVTHGGLSNYLRWSIAEYMTAAGDVPLQTRIGFDLSVTALFAPLLSGRCLQLIPQTAEAEGLLACQDAVFIKLTPSQLDLLATEIEPSRAASLARQFIVGGEALTGDTLRFWRNHAPHTSIVNEYGPTETVVGCCTYRDDPSSESEIVPIGKPIWNTQLYVLDSGMRPVAVGALGELYIGGAGVARGYVNRPELTAERFVPNPFSRTPGERLYQTGDRVRWRNDGNLEYLGRFDEQVKLRGYRIELGEIEAVLREHPGVSQAAVVVRGEGGNRKLAAYVVAQAGAEVGPRELRAHVQSKLPEYMTPRSVVMLERLPLTGNGKLDRKALPEAEEAGEETTYEGPRTPVEEILAGIWEQVLERRQIGREENFFELGGHSLLGAQLVSRVRSAFGVELPLRVLFESPTIAAVALEVERARRQGQALPKPALLPAKRTGDMPLSFAQQRLWFIDQLEPGSAAYNIPMGVRLEGALDRRALEGALTELVRRHEVLRTTFPSERGEAVQRITAAGRVEVPVIDLRSVAGAERLAQRLGREEAERPFDLARGPVFRVKLLQLREQEYDLLMTIHHISSDGWSSGVMVREFGRLYEAYREGKGSPLAELPVQYADYAVWQRGWLQGEVLERQLGYWKRQLEGLEPLELPTDFPRPSVPVRQGGYVPFRIPAETTRKLHNLSQEEGATLFMTVLAAFQMVLGRWSGQQDVAIGADIASRNQFEAEGLIGYFVNQLVLRSQWADDPSFRQFLQRVKKTVLDGYEHQDLPFEKLVEELEPERSLNRAPLFQVKLVWQNAVGRDPLESPPSSDNGPTGGSVDSESSYQRAEFDLIVLVLSEKAGSIQGGITYPRSLFAGATMERLLGKLRVLLEQILENPAARVGQFELLSPAERQGLLAWNQTEVALKKQSVPESFRRQSEHAPDAVAVVFEDQYLTYGELDRRSNQLAHYLRSYGVGPEVRVGIGLERSLEMVTAIMGVLKADGAYVPLDPSLPPSRLAYMVEDARPIMMITQASVAGDLPSSWWHTLRLDEDWGEIAAYSSAASPVKAGPENLAYVIYTSGSTGAPKGVLVPHRGLCSLIGAETAHAGVTGVSRYLQYVPFAADVAISDLGMALLSGATLVLTPQGQRHGEAVEALIRREQITHAAIPPAVIAGIPNHDLPALQVLMTGGEDCSAIVDTWSDGRRLINLYGPTETTVCASMSNPLVKDEAPAIGKPIWNTQMYVLDDRMQMMPVGVPGELYIGGAGVARGYVNMPDATADRFVPNPFQGAGTRLYRTGDRVKWRPTGNLEFLGRFDHQVKLRGNRIELGEIEAILREDGAIAQAAVVVRGEGAGKRLVAYVVPEVGASPDARELRAHLQRKLPEYMVPSAYVKLDSFPLTANGKLDRKRLPDAAEMHDPREKYQPPETELEQALTEIWEQVLKRERIGRDEDFFELGGHSLLATQLVSRVRTTLDVELPLRALFESPTIEGLAQEVELARQEEMPQRPAIIALDRPWRN